jgi:hypothetical protein
MTTAELPATTAGITPEWLASVLDAPVRAIERKTIGAGAGFVGDLSRLTLTYHSPAPDAPRTLIAKLPTTDETVRTIAQLFGFYEREVRFYQDLAHRVALRTPRPYLAAMDPPAGRFVLLLEDLAPGRCGDQIASCSPDEARLALRELARMQAPWWQSPQLDELPWLPLTGDPLLSQVLATLFQQSWPFFVETNRARLPDELIAIGERFGAQFVALAASARDRPHTLIHTDYRLDNMFFDLPDGSPLAVIDWQLLQRGPGPIDVTYFLAGNLPPGVRREHERALLRTYHDELVRCGVEGYSFDDCLEDYRRAALLLLIFVVTRREDIDLASYGERAEALLDAMLERYTTAILDLNAAEFLPA